MADHQRRREAAIKEEVEGGPDLPLLHGTTSTEDLLIDAIDAGQWDELRSLLRSDSFRSDSFRRHLAGGSAHGGDGGSDGLAGSGDRRYFYFGSSLRCACMSRRIPPDVVSSMLSRADLDVLFPPRSPSAPFQPRASTHLHNACAFGRDATVSAVLHALGPDRAAEEARRLSYAYLTPLEDAWLGHLSANRDRADAIRRVRAMASAGDFAEFQRSHRRADLRELWNKTTALLLASERRSLGFCGGGPLWDGRQWRAVHAVAGCGRVGGGAAGACFSSNELQTHCPSIVMWFALKLYPDQSRQRDEFGDLPLHIAVSNPVHHGVDLHIDPGDADDANGTVRSALEELNRPVASMLLKLHPAAARFADRSGRLPLNLALEGYDRWTTARRARSMAAAADEGGPRWLKRDDPSEWTDVVLDIMRAAPEALATRDVRTWLYPFMLAATVRSAPLDVPFLLLRANPAMVRGGVRPTRQERYLEDKLRALKRERERHVAELTELRAKVARLERSPG